MNDHYNANHQVLNVRRTCVHHCHLFIAACFIVVISPNEAEAHSHTIGSTRPVIVLDPGHSGKDIAEIDKATGLIDHDYPNEPEMTEVFEISKAIQEKLKGQGYDVRLTKRTKNESVSLRQRASIAQDAKAVLAVSIHTDHTRLFENFAQVYAQNLGTWRGRTANNPKSKFTNELVAAVSQKYAKTFALERTKIEKHPVVVTTVSFTGRKGLEPGNIPEVQLFAGTGGHALPWVYNEVGGIGFGPAQKQLYADAIAQAIRVCIPINANTSTARNSNVDIEAKHKLK